MASYYHVPATVPSTYETIPDRVRTLAEKQPNQPAFIVYRSKDQRQLITRKELYDGAVKFAKVLLKLGIKKGEMVAFCVSNSVDWMIYDLGIIMAGACSVRLLVGLTDFQSALDGCNVAIFDSKHTWDEFLSIAQLSDNGKVSCDVCPTLRLAIAVSETYRPPHAPLATELMAQISDRDNIDLPHLEAENTAIIMQTSGTTGVPKKVCHTHYNCITVSTNFCQNLGITSEDILYNSRPMAYVGGYPFQFLGVGLTQVTGDAKMLNDPQNFDFVINLWRKEKCSIVNVPPHNLKSLTDCRFRVNMILSGGDMLTNEMIESSFTFTKKMIVMYGSTELLYVAVKVFTPENISEHRQGMLGIPIPDTEVKIVNEEKNVVDMGTKGFLCVRNKWMAKRYQSGRSCLKNDWFLTSDICWMSTGGELIMTGRSTGFIKKATVNLSIQLIEEYVERHPSVDNAVVVPIPDSKVGQTVCACVTILAGQEFDEDALMNFCIETMPQQTHFDWVSMIPDYILHFESFPNLSSAKFDRKKIRTLAVERIGNSN